MKKKSSWVSKFLENTNKPILKQINKIFLIKAEIIRIRGVPKTQLWNLKVNKTELFKTQVAVILELLSQVV